MSTSSVHRNPELGSSVPCALGVRLNRRTLQDFALAWTVTPVVSGAVAAATFLLVR